MENLLFVSEHWEVKGRKFEPELTHSKPSLGPKKLFNGKNSSQLLG